MQFFKTHIIKYIFGFLLSLSILAPSLTKFAHTFSHSEHHHEVCNGEASTHLHTLDLDCEFYKFKLNAEYELTTFESLNYNPIYFSETPDSYISFLNNNIQLHCFLRGPPHTIG